jgi:hypothetical protein
MCIIIDANQAHIISEFGRCPYYTELVRWVSKGGKIVSGGKLEAELFRINSMRALITEWKRSGRLVSICSVRLKELENDIRASCISNDPHVVALAKLSDADVVVTSDNALVGDLKNRLLVGKKVRIFKAPKRAKVDLRAHKKMLSDSQCKL